MEGENSSIPASVSTPHREARVGLLIPTHALPVLSYLIPEHLAENVQPGSAVIAPLSGYSRLGIVVDVVDGTELSREYLRDVLDGLSISPELSEVCCRLSELFAVPISTVLRTALSPGLSTERYRIVDPGSDWPWETGLMVGRTTLRRTLGADGLKAAEDEGRVKFVVPKPGPKFVEWAEVRTGSAPDLSRASRQRQIYETLSTHEGGCQTSLLLAETGASRGSLRQLVKRGAIRLKKRPEAPPVLDTRGSETESTESYARDAGRVVDRGGAWFWRVPSRGQAEAVAAFVEAVVEGGEQALVMAPEVETIESLVNHLADNLPVGYTVAPYHSGLDKKRSEIYKRARDGRIDVLIGTCAAALAPMKRLGALCVVDEPNTAHRPELGYEGLPIHVRDVALERAKAEDCGVLFLSPFPSLRVSSPVSRVKELPARPAPRWPSARIVDMRGSGATLSSALIDVCRRSLEEGKRIALIANRLGYATSVSCDHCGAVKSCPSCDLPLTLRKPNGALACVRCGYRVAYSARCEACGSERTRATGFAIDRLRDAVSRSLDVPVGKISAGCREQEDSRIVVATARFVVGGDWDVVAVPDADALLLGSYIGATEQAFRVLYGAAESAADLILVQTRQPEHQALQAALKGDYSAFAVSELPKLRDLGYPPYGHLAALVMDGKEEAVRRAVESQIRPSLEPGVNMSDAITLARNRKGPVWRVLLRSSDHEAVARSGALAARRAAKTYGPNSLKVQVEIDPEEV
ncbi:primosomal protein N' [soil metagenome]